MDTDLMTLIDSLSDDDAMRLAVGVKDDLDRGRGDAALAGLTPETARVFLAGIERAATDRGAPGDRARIFLRSLVELDAFNAIIAQRLVDAGVRLGVQDVVDWFTGEFNLASLLGISFEFESEKIETVATDSGSIQKRRTIKLAVGTKD